MKTIISNNTTSGIIIEKIESIIDNNDRTFKVKGKSELYNPENNEHIGIVKFEIPKAVFENIEIRRIRK